MKICIPVYDNVNMLDVCGPMEMFGWAGYETFLAAEKPSALRFLNGFPFFVERSFESVDEADVLWTPGGDPGALATLINDASSPYLEFLVRMQPRVQVLASVCEGALLLAAAGLLDGYEVTTHWAFVPCLTQHFPKVRVAPGHPRFHLDRDRLTGGGISSGLDEALQLIAMLSGAAVAEGVQRTTQYYPEPPVSSVIPPATVCRVDIRRSSRGQ